MSRKNAAWGIAMKKICHITSAHRRYDPRIFQKECRSLAKEGYHVYLLVNDKMPCEKKDGVKIVPTGFSSQNRIKRFFLSHKKILKRAIAINADIYHFHDPDLLLLGLRLKKRGKKVIFDSHENVREDIKDKEYLPKVVRNLISWAYVLIETYVLKRIDAVIGVTPQQMVLLNKMGNKTALVTNYPEYKETDNKRYLEKNGICFAGTIFDIWSHETILDILDKVDIKYKLCGIVEDSYLETLKKHRNWRFVEYRGVLDYDKVGEFLGSSIAGMALLKQTQNVGSQGTMGNTKIFEYMKAGIPVIMADFPLWKNIVNKYGCGICVNIKDKKEIIKAIRYIIDHPDKAIEMGENGRKAYKEEYNWETQVGALLDLYKKL